MTMLRVSTFSLCAVVLLVQSALAQTVSVDVTIKAVQADSHGITVSYKVGATDKTTTLDVSRRATITLAGQKATLDSLKPGLKASIEYHKELAIVTKIDATAVVTRTHDEAAPAPELVEVSELNGEGLNDHPWLSEDGLTIYWDRGRGRTATIWTARRQSLDAIFDDRKSLFSGKCPTLSSDGLEMFLVGDRTDGADGKSLQLAKRESLDQQFGRPSEIPELRAFNANAPVLSHDGLTLYFGSTAKGMTSTTFYSIRKDKLSPWNPPSTLPPLQSGDHVYFAFLTADGLTVLGTEGRNMFVCSRESPQHPFGKPSQIEVNNAPLLGLWPRYVGATNELFFASSPKKGKGLGIWVVKNFMLPVVAQGR